MIIGLLCLGFFVLAQMPNTDPKKLDILVGHMSGGMVVLGLDDPAPDHPQMERPSGRGDDRIAPARPAGARLRTTVCT